jgi:hypothetical protein
MLEQGIVPFQVRYNLDTMDWTGLVKRMYEQDRMHGRGRRRRVIILIMAWRPHQFARDLGKPFTGNTGEEDWIKGKGQKRRLLLPHDFLEGSRRNEANLIRCEIGVDSKSTELIVRLKRRWERWRRESVRSLLVANGALAILMEECPCMSHG